MYIAIPQPELVEVSTGFFPLTRLTAIYLPPEAGALEVEAARLLQAEIARAGLPELPISRALRPPVSSGVLMLGSPEAVARVRGTEDTFLTLSDHPEAYALTVAVGSIWLTGASARGRLWAAQTLRQMIRLHGTILPQVRLSDAPAMRYRGVLLDVARRKVPTLDTLFELVDTLSLLKLNMFQLQVEHTFRWLRHPEIGRGASSLTTEDMLALDAHCRARGIELVPMLQSFGHMKNILSLDTYRHLAESDTHRWSLNPTDPASVRFMDELYEEFLPCFSSSLINIGCDETFDLGAEDGKSRAAIAEKGKGRVYLDFVRQLHDLLTTKYGKRVMFWGDIVLHHPELIPDIPKDMIVLNWDYSAKERFEQVQPFAASGLEQIICPSTNTWNAVFPRTDDSWANVAHFVRDGRAVGALGMLNTEWGDGGHYNLLGCALYGFAHGADASWAAKPLARDAFDAILGPVLFGAEGDRVVTAIRTLGRLAGTPKDFHPSGSVTIDLLFNNPMGEDPRVRDLPAELLADFAATGDKAAEAFAAAVAESYLPEALRDMAWAAAAVAYGARKTAFLQEIMDLSEGKGGDPARLIARCVALMNEHDGIFAGFRERWYAENRHSEIEVALGHLLHAGAVLHAVHRWLLEHVADFARGPVPLPELPYRRRPWQW